VAQRVSASAGIAKRVGGARVRARARLSPEDPGRVKPKGATSGRCTNPAAVARNSRQGESPGAAARWAGPAASAAGKTDGKNGMWVHRLWKRGGYLPEGESSEGRIPRAPPARKKAGKGSEGVSRREGNQTLRTERSGLRQGLRQWTSEPGCAVGNESPREELAGCGWSARTGLLKTLEEGRTRREVALVA
jgi:hypothetical protein